MNASTTHHVPRLFEPELLRRAGWMAMSYATPPDGPPVLGLVFRDPDIAEAIFTGWRHALGPVDVDDLLRVAIIEGVLPNTPPGYTVHLGLNLEVVVAQVRAAGGGTLDFDASAVDAWRRMPDPASSGLRRFREAYAKHRRYLLGPVVLTNRSNAMAHLKIEKRRLVLRRVSDVGLVNDPDAGLWLR